jgi:hypothetical protein
MSGVDDAPRFGETFTRTLFERHCATRAETIKEASICDERQQRLHQKLAFFPRIYVSINHYEVFIVHSRLRPIDSQFHARCAHSAAARD